MGANSQAMRPSLRTGAMLVFLVMCAPTAQAQCCDGCKHVHHQAGQGGRCWSGCADHCCEGCKHANHQAVWLVAALVSTSKCGFDHRWFGGCKSLLLCVR